MNTLEDNRLVRTFAQLRAAGRKALLPFITAGYPDLETTEAILGDLEGRGLVICELGIPFSDPIADGPVIQASYTEAIAGGIDSAKIFAMVRRFRQASLGKLALIAMVSYSIVFRHGVEAYLKRACGAGFDGMIIPDLPINEAASLEPLAAGCGLANIMLIAPTTPPQRQLEIARHSRGFLYYISVAGITGERTKLPPQAIEAVAQLRRHTETPVCVGFGISNAATVAEVCRVADGAIVGSAIVHRIADAKARGLSRERIVEEAGRFIDELRAPIT